MWFISSLRAPVPPVWAIAAITLIVLGVGWRIFSLAQQLATVSAETIPRVDAVPYAVAEMVRDGDTVTIEIQGSPGATVVLLAPDRPAIVLTLDRKGRGTVPGLDPADATPIEIAAFAEPPDAIPPLPTLTPTSSPTEVPTGTATPTATGTETSTATATASATATPSRTATKTPRRVPTRSQSPTATRPRNTPARSPAATRKFRTSTDPASSKSPPVLHLVADAGNRIAVTFDGNASSNGTAELLDLLTELDLEITLFVTGGFVEKYPTLVRRAVLAGHEVGNHTYSHPHLTSYADNRRHDLLPNISKAWFHDQLRRTEEAYRRATGRPMAPLWRAPYGEENSRLRGWALELGYLHVRWSSVEGASLDARDWVADEHSSLYQDSRRMMDRLLGFPRLEGGIVLMHLATERSEPPWIELPRFVRELERRNVEPVKISDMLGRSKTWRKWLDQARENHNKNFPE